ncbi:MAG: hypothetical protein ACLPUG_09455 [Acidimicrobiales bacterium]
MSTLLEQYVSGMGKLARERENGRYDRAPNEANELTPDEQSVILWVTKMECGILDDTTPEELSDEQAEVLGYHLTSGEDD